MGSRRRLGRFLLDTTPLRLDRDYRWLWGGQVVSGMGTQITRLALPYQVYLLTGSTLAIAALTFFQLIPILLFALIGGSLADAVDRRRLLLITQAGLAVCSIGFVLLALEEDPSLPALFALAFVSAGLAAVDQPARGASIPRLVPPERLPAALALNQLNHQGASIIGPALAGVLIATVGLVGAYLVDVVSFVATLLALVAISPIPPIRGAVKPGFAAIREGLRFARLRRPILGSFLLDLTAMIFAMPTALLPVLATDVFRVGPIGLGLLAAAPGAGAFLGALFSGWVGRVRRVGRAVFLAVTGWGLAITAFGVTALVATPTAFALGLLALALAGAADMLSAVFRSTIIQLEAPDELRGRVTSIHSLVVSAGPRVGDVQVSLVAAVIGPAATVVVGGMLCLGGVAALARWMPDFAQHVIERRPGRVVAASAPEPPAAPA